MWRGERHKQLPGPRCPGCAGLGIEVTDFISWYHLWLCPACGLEWRGALILDSERELRRGELG